MIPCKGIHRIICTRKTDCPRGVKKNVQPYCISCPDALTQIIDLEGKIIYEYLPAIALAQARRAGQVKEERRKGTKAQRDKGTEAQRDKGTKGQRHKGTEGQNTL